MVTDISIGSKSVEDDVIRIQSRYLSDPCLSDIDFENEMARVPLNVPTTTLLLTEKKLILNSASVRSWLMKQCGIMFWQTNVP